VDETGRKGVWEVMVARNGEHRRTEGDEEPVRALELCATAPVAEIAGCDDELGLHALDERGHGRLDVRVLAYTGMEIGNVEDACAHERMRL
jgi:hypothetical protein